MPNGPARVLLTVGEKSTGIVCPDENGFCNDIALLFVFYKERLLSGTEV